MHSLTDAALWYLVLIAVSWAAAPWVALLCPRLGDRGAGIARPVGLLLTVFPTWWLSSVHAIPWSTVGLWVTVVVVALVGYGLALRRRLLDRRWLAAMLAAEVIALAAFGLYIWFRGFQPLIGMTEKPMDSLFLASSMRTDQMPPPDPWFAGQPINYYYLGYLINGAAGRMAQVPEGVAFNLALASTFSMTVAVASSVAFNVVRRFASLGRAVAAGCLGAFFVAWSGNTDSFLRFFRDMQAERTGFWWSGLGWLSSRVIVDSSGDQPISEFPAFSFVLGDLHPHVMALPFVLTSLLLAFNLLALAPPAMWRLRRGEQPTAMASRSVSSLRWWSTVVVSGALIGSLYALNSWDLPTYLLIAAVAVWVAATQRPVIQRVGSVVALAAAAVIAWLPFYVVFSPPVGSGAGNLPGWVEKTPVLSTIFRLIAPVTVERTSLSEYLRVFGIPTVIAIIFLAVSLSLPRRRNTAGLRPGELLIIVVALLILTFAGGTPVFLLAGLIITGALELVRREGAVTPRSIAASLFALGYALSVVIELFYLRDVFGSRMNTIFKVQYQIWVLFGIASALAVVTVWSDARRIVPSLRPALRPAVVVAAVVALLLGSVYPIVSAQRYSVVYQDAGWTTLDGTAWMRKQHPDDMAGIDWLNAHADRDSRVLEASACDYSNDAYTPGNPVSSFTGLPTWMGWAGHEDQWRRGIEPWDSEIQPRANEVATLYANPAQATAAPYSFDYVFVGTIEQQGLDDSGGHPCAVSGPYDIEPAKFAAAGWQAVFQQGDVTIYGRPGTQGTGQ